MWRASRCVFALMLLLNCLPAMALNSAEENESAIIKNTSPVKMHAVRRIGEHRGFSVDVRYPYFSGGYPDVIHKLNQEVKRAVDMHIPNLPSPHRSFWYQCDFSESLVTSQFVSFNLNFDNETGGAHGDSFNVPLNAQLYPHFQILKLKNAFGKKKVNYARLSKLCIHQMYGGQHGALTVDDLSPSEFEHFTFDRRGITFELPEEKPGPDRMLRPITIPYKLLRPLMGLDAPLRNVPLHTSG